MSSEKNSQLNQNFLNFFTKTVICFKSNFDFTNFTYLKPLPLRKIDLTFDGIQCAFKCLKMDSTDRGSLYDKFRM